MSRLGVTELTIDDIARAVTLECIIEERMLDRYSRISIHSPDPFVDLGFGDRHDKQVSREVSHDVAAIEHVRRVKGYNL